MKNQNQKLNLMVKISLLSAIAFILMFIEVAVPIFPSFLKLDISDLPALIGTFALGPIAGVAIELIKNILHGIFVGGTAFVGELANFLVGAILVYVSGFVYSHKKTKVNALIALVSGTIVMSIAATILNYFVFLPLYESVLHFPIKAVVAMGTALNPHITNLNSFVVMAILPFNLLKGVIVSALTMALYKSVSPLIHKEAEKLKTAGEKL